MFSANASFFVLEQTSFLPDRRSRSMGKRVQITERNYTRWHSESAHNDFTVRADIMISAAGIEACALFSCHASSRDTSSFAMKLLTLYDRCELRRVFKRNALKFAAPALPSYFRNSKLFREHNRTRVCHYRAHLRSWYSLELQISRVWNNKAPQSRLVNAIAR